MSCWLLWISTGILAEVGRANRRLSKPAESVAGVVCRLAPNGLFWSDESMMGVLMCGISVSLLFALVTHLVDKDPELLIGADNNELRQGASYG